MRRRFLKKIRNFRLMSGIVIALLTILSFQNCAPAKQECASGSKNCTSEGSTNQSSTSSSSSSGGLWGSGSNNNSGQFAGGSGGSVSNGSSGSGSYSGGGVSSGGSGGSSGGSGGGSSGGGGTGGSNNTTFRILKDVANTSVREGESFNLEVSISGGTGPYKFQWYKDGAAITSGLGSYSFFSDVADSYTKEGIYYAEVTDANQQKVRSYSARVAFVEPTVGCDAGSYFTYTNSQYDAGYNYFTEYLDGPRGKFLLHKSYDTMGFLYQNSNYSKLTAFTVTANLPYQGSTYISCRTTIPRIHSPQANPGWNNSDNWNGSSQYADGYNYKYTGQVNFECRNKKLLYKSNTCKWVYTPPPRTTNDR